MAKTVQIAIRLDEEEKEKLDQLCEATVRTQSDMVRYFIRKEWDLMFGRSRSDDWLQQPSG